MRMKDVIISVTGVQQGVNGPDAMELVTAGQYGQDEKETLFVKRIIALEGDVVDIRKNEETGICEVYVNDEKLDEPYLDDWQTTVPRNMEFPHTVAKNCLFVLGDNRIVSNDSRSIGDVDARRLVGRILIRIAPLNKFGAVEG